jgi:hypothetical protein
METVLDCRNYGRCLHRYRPWPRPVGTARSTACPLADSAVSAAV